MSVIKNKMEKCTNEWDKDSYKKNERDKTSGISEIKKYSYENRSVYGIHSTIESLQCNTFHKLSGFSKLFFLISRIHSFRLYYMAYYRPYTIDLVDYSVLPPVEKRLNFSKKLIHFKHFALMVDFSEFLNCFDGNFVIFCCCIVFNQRILLWMCYSCALFVYHLSGCAMMLVHLSKEPKSYPLNE